jgi:hypothetical protein
MGCLPEWWSGVYNPASKGIDPFLFADILRSPTVDEILHTLRRCEGGKAPGPDTVSIDLLKVVTNPDLLGQSKGSALIMLCELTTFAFRHTCSSESDKTNHVTMLPKPLSDGSWSCDADKMRPIMVGNEVCKLRQRILSTRIGSILLDHPTRTS